MASVTTNYGFDVPTSSDLVKNGATQIALLGQDLDTFLFRPFTRNAVINGGFDIAQRGTSVSVPASTNTATLDRFQLNVGANGASTVSQQPTADTTNLPNIRYCARVQRNSGQTGTTTMYFASSMETSVSVPYAGQTVTLSFYARAGSNFSSASSVLGFTLRSGTGTDENVYGYTGGASPISTTRTLTTTWQRFTATATVAATATELAVYFNYTPTGTASTNDYFEITGIQLEVGAQSSPFARAGATIQGELAACQRYYYRQSIAATPARFAVGMVNSATTANFTTYLPVQMRTAPTALEQSGTAGDYSVVGSGTTITVCSAVPSVGSNSVNVVQYNFTVASGLTAGQAIEARPVNTNAYLGWSAEL